MSLGLTDTNKIKLAYPKGNQSWIFIGRTDAEAEPLILWLPDAKSWLIGKDSDAGKDWNQKEKRVTENEIIGWHHQLNGHECKQILGDSEGLGSVASCSPWGHKELDMTYQLNKNNSILIVAAPIYVSTKGLLLQCSFFSIYLTLKLSWQAMYCPISL